MTDIIVFLVVVGVLTEERSLLSTEEAYSENCSHDLTQYWDRKAGRCRPCQELEAIVAGHEFSANCGQDDHSGARIPTHRPCPQGTYNNGSYIKCQDCKVCSPGQPTLMECSKTRDTQCCRKGEQVINGKCLKMTTSILTTTTLSTTEAPTDAITIETPTTLIITEAPTDAITIETPTTLIIAATPTPVTRLLDMPLHASSSWIFPVAISVLLIVVAVLFFALKRRRGAEFECIGVQRKPPDGHVSIKDSLLHLETNSHQPIMLKASEENLTTSDVKHPLPNVMEPCNILAPKIEKAPVSVVLDNLDVLEELVMLLDPEHPWTKSTRHVAARCAFSATWVSYVYSMRDTRSPLRAVIEGVAAKFPEWTVGDLARVFMEIGRNDAVAVLTKLPLSGDC